MRGGCIDGADGERVERHLERAQMTQAHVTQPILESALRVAQRVEGTVQLPMQLALEY